MVVAQKVNRSLTCICAFLCMIGVLYAQDSSLTPGATPTDAQQGALLASVRRYAEQYVTNLPNFTCIQVTEQFESGVKPNKWRKGDTIATKLVFSQGKEQRTLESVNNKQVRLDKVRSLKQPLVTEGEFGVLLGNIFEALSDTEFKWRRWEDLNGKNLIVFDYSIDKEHSGLRLGISEQVEAVVPYSGSVYADPATGAVWRVTQNITEIPVEVQTKSSSTEIDYQEQTIGGNQYLLPFHASVNLDTGLRHIRNEMTFRDYRKFEVESNIKFTPESGGGSDTPR